VGEPVRGGVEQRPAPQVVDDDRAVAVCQRGDLRRIGRLREARLGEVRWMDPEDDLRPAFGERRFEVDGARPVGRPDLDQPRPGPPNDLRNPDTAADLDELATADRHATAAGQPDCECHGRCVVVRDQRVLCAGQRNQRTLGRPKAMPAPAAVPVQLEEQVLGGGPLGGRGHLRGPRRSAEVRVDDHTRGVDDGHERVSPRTCPLVHSCDGEGRQGFGLAGGIACRERGTLLGDHLADDLRPDIRFDRSIQSLAHAREHALDARRSGSV
jgi:hypothetical protein